MIFKERNEDMNVGTKKEYESSEPAGTKIEHDGGLWIVNNANCISFVSELQEADEIENENTEDES